MKLITFTLSLFLAFSVFGDQITDMDSRLTTSQKEMAIDMEKQIMAACCFGGPVHSHGRNDYTEEQRLEIRQLILDGKNEDQILNYFREKIDKHTGRPYGNRILAAPKSNELLGQVSYWMVAVFSIVGLVVLWFVLRKLIGQRQPVQLNGKISDPAGNKTNAKILEKVESELRDLDKD
ncbi:MAG TPA: hypothetical protein DHU63_12795 [Candidatus Marinimicrobia bacterium]|nr:hypothetical protein [Candidatus Neomarinimicrobiota bacterium]